MKKDNNSCETKENLEKHFYPTKEDYNESNKRRLMKHIAEHSVNPILAKMNENAIKIMDIDEKIKKIKSELNQKLLNETKTQLEYMLDVFEKKRGFLQQEQAELDRKFPNFINKNETVTEETKSDKTDLQLKVGDVVNVDIPCQFKACGYITKVNDFDLHIKEIYTDKLFSLPMWKDYQDFINVSPQKIVQSDSIDTETENGKPTIEQIKEFMESKGFDKASEESVKFFNFYEKNGWRIGKSPIKNWKSSVDKWISMYTQEPNQKEKDSTVREFRTVEEQFSEQEKAKYQRQIDEYAIKLKYSRRDLLESTIQKFEKEKQLSELNDLFTTLNYLNSKKIETSLLLDKLDILKESNPSLSKISKDNLKNISWCRDFKKVQAKRINKQIKSLNYQISNLCEDIIQTESFIKGIHNEIYVKEYDKKLDKVKEQHSNMVLVGNNNIIETFFNGFKPEQTQPTLIEVDRKTLIDHGFDFSQFLQCTLEKDDIGKEKARYFLHDFSYYEKDSSTYIFEKINK